MTNKELYESPAAVSRYTQAEKIQLPEATLIGLLKDKLVTMSMLDLGIGGGRTTLHFGDLVGDYLGTDFATNMVESSKKRFASNSKLKFEVADATDLSKYSDESFDIVLFSFNGIDYIDAEKRSIALEEIKRVLKKGGIFFFSSHNILSLKNLFALQKTYNPIKVIGRLYKAIMLRWLNGSPENLIKKERVAINDGSWNYNLITYYSTPLLQIQDLQSVGFSNIRAYSIHSGKEIEAELFLQITDDRIYYYCEK